MKYICGPDWDQRVVDINELGRVGIIMSGGIDSYVLYNMLKDPIVFNIRRKDGFDRAERIRNLIHKDIIEVDEVTDDHKDRIGHTIGKILDDYNVDQLYMGINHTPPTYYFSEFDTTNKPHRPWRIDGVVKAPFLHLYKYHIIDLANKLEIDLSGTRSCIQKVDGDECGKCWQCCEKRWGYDQLKN